MLCLKKSLKISNMHSNILAGRTDNAMILEKEGGHQQRSRKYFTENTKNELWLIRIKAVTFGIPWSPLGIYKDVVICIYFTVILT